MKTKQMEVNIFIENIKEAFGEAGELPVAFWHSDTPVSEHTEKINGCFFKEFEKLKEGESICLSNERIGCMGGKFYTGFTEMGERIPNFVSLKEKYKKTPEMVLDFVQKMGVPLVDEKFLNISPIDQIESFDNIVGILFFATPDQLSGLASWAFFDNNSDDAVTTKFGSGCSSIFTEVAVENSKNGRRTFIGLFDPSVRRHIQSNILSFAIPMSRFKEMYYTMRECCLFDTPAWGKIRDRMRSGKDISSSESTN